MSDGNGTPQNESFAEIFSKIQDRTARIGNADSTRAGRPDENAARAARELFDLRRDRDLMSRLMEGGRSRDALAAAALFVLWYAPLHAHLKRRWSGLQDGEIHDLIQDVWCAIWKNGHEHLNPTGNFWGWLRKQAENKAIDHFRKREHARARKTPVPRVIPFEEGADFPDTMPDPSQRLVEDETRKRIEAAVLSKFSGLQREIVRLAFFHDVAKKTIATQLNTSEFYVHKTLHSARRRLHAVLSPPERETPPEKGPRRHRNRVCGNLHSFVDSWWCRETWKASGSASLSASSDLLSPHEADDGQ